VARASSATEIRELASARWSVRLGHNVFTRKRLDPRTMERAVEAFRHFRSLLDRYEVDEYSAVATSAMREAANRDALLEQRVFQFLGENSLAADFAQRALPVAISRSADDDKLGRRSVPRQSGAHIFRLPASERAASRANP